ncbi:chloramphenicol acetyltransferase [marine bacterium AO1-C]|nr:chloramphenicol acetyltransferase [marine bacterium AO1-C]
MKILDKENWNRKEHFEFFSQCNEPFFGITVEVDVTKAYQQCKANNDSFFLYYHFLSTQAVNEVPEFKYRIKEDNVVVFDQVHTTTTLLREDKTFMFSFLPYTQSFEEFVTAADEEKERAQNSTGLGITENTSRLDTIHYSAIPWINFKGLTHARNFDWVDSNPKISFGKLDKSKEQITMPVAIFVHHGLMDAYHVSLYIDKFQELLHS